jgi:hypothetical protein
MMNAKAKALLDAHVNFILDELSGERLKGIIQEETSFIYDHLAKVKINDVLTKQEVLDFQKRNFDHRNKVSEPVKAYAKSLRGAVVKHLKSSNATMADMVDKSTFDQFMTEVSKQREIREKLIHAAVSNPLYGEVIANTVSSGIKSFTSEEGLAGKIPGASSFFKMGGGILSGLSDSLDKNVRKFVTENIPKLTAQSEKYINTLVDDRKVKEMGEQIWSKAKGKTVGQLVARMNEEQFDSFEPIVEAASNHFLKSAFVAGINEVVVDHFFAESGNKSIQQILTDIEITKADVLRESEDLVVKIVAEAKKDGTLESRIRKHLSSFYELPMVDQILQS